MDTFTTAERSRIMARIRSVNTGPEMRVRSALHSLGYRFRLHRKELPGKPDIVLPKLQTVLFVNGCFWHRHYGCKFASTPATKLDYWLPKFENTVKRDYDNYLALIASGWRVIVIWECQTRDLEQLLDLLEVKLAS